METIYCFDSSALINSWSRYYPDNIFPSLWSDLFIKLINEKRIIMPIEAKKEILNGNDGLCDWIKNNDSCIKGYTAEQLKIAQEIVTKYPKAAQYKKIKPYHADPFVIALAKVENAIVVTFEGNTGNPNDPKIPMLCKEFGVECFDLIGFFKKENIEFRHS